MPVPPALGFCDDLAVNGSPFYVMGFVDGFVVRDRPTAETGAAPGGPGRPPADRSSTRWRRSTPSTSTAAGLDDLARHDGYIARQLKRWHGQWTQQQTRELPLVDEVHDALAARIPEQGPGTIVHGDYRLDNTIVSADGDVAAVLDWEICTLGDPLADLGVLMVYWTGPDDEPSVWGGQATTAAGLLGPRRAARRATPRCPGATSSGLGFYVAFGYWKLACIIEGVYARYLGGALGRREPAELAPFARQVEDAVRKAAETPGGAVASLVRDE